MVFSSPGLLLGNVHVDEERVEPEMKHLLLQTGEREREEEEEEEEGKEKESEFTWDQPFQ